MKTYLQVLYRYRIWFPVLSAVLLVLALPPISLSYVALVGLVPMLVFSYFAYTPRSAAVGWGLFALVYVSYITYSTIIGFNWIDEATLFVGLIKAFGFGVIIGATVLFGVLGFITKVIELSISTALPKFHRFIVVVMIAMMSVLAVDYTLYTLFSGFNYGALFFASQHIPYLLAFIDLGHPVMISLAVVLVNLSVFATLLFVSGRLPLPLYSGTLVLLFLYMLLPRFVHDVPAYVTGPVDEIEIAIIQDSERSETLAFGHIENGVFVFPGLEAHLETLQDASVDFIIYPFAPWNGVMGKYADNSRFDRTVIAIDEATFGTWVTTHVPPHVTFVTWFTTYQDGNFYNQIVFYRDGARVGTYSKRHLFPFFDYTPAWALERGIVSLPFDGTPGDTNQEPITFGTARIGSLVCSEVGDDGSTALSAAGSNLLFSIGSESMFTHQIPGEYNALRAQFSAEKHNIPVVRANKFGPSVVYDGNGSLLGRMEYNETGILRVTVPYAPLVP